ncbi:hypothetical protein [Streptomyces sp. NPDC017529]|uniref:hypothetical protein n=1 Tax=Streptomyces sp. NPDC017529 TaxID=3365000 RepID=UPI003791D9DB
MLRSRPLRVAAAAALALCAGTALTLGIQVPAMAAPAATAPVPAPLAAGSTTGEPSLTGAGQLKRRPGDDVHFAFDARGFADKAGGTFSAGHHVDGKWGQSSAPFETLAKGGFKVRHWMPPRPAAQG